MESVSKKILAQKITSRPMPLPSKAIGPGSEALPLLRAVANTTYQLAHPTPYRGPIANMTAYTNQTVANMTIARRHADIMPSATQSLVRKNPYVDMMEMGEMMRMR